MSKIIEFKHNEVEIFELKIEDFDYIDFIWLTEEVLPSVYSDQENFVMKNEWSEKISTLDNVKISFKSNSGMKVFVPISKEVMNSLYKKNKLAPAFVVRNVIAYALDEVIEAKGMSLGDDLEKKS